VKREEIVQRVIKLAGEKLSADAKVISEKTSFQEDLNADSIDITDFIMELESEFDVEIPDEDLEKIRTVGDASDYIQKRLG
jgi:acyl carrier protein